MAPATAATAPPPLGPPPRDAVGHGRHVVCPPSDAQSAGLVPRLGVGGEPPHRRRPARHPAPPRRRHGGGGRNVVARWWWWARRRRPRALCRRHRRRAAGGGGGRGRAGAGAACRGGHAAGAANGRRAGGDGDDGDGEGDGEGDDDNDGGAGDARGRPSARRSLTRGWSVGGDDGRPAGRGAGRGVCALAAHPAGDVLLAATRGAGLSFLSSATGRPLAAAPADGATTTTAGWHPDGLVAGAGTATGAVRLWDVKAGGAAATLVEAAASDGDGDGDAAVTGLSFSENGYYVVTAGARGVRVWDLRKLAVARAAVGPGWAGGASRWTRAACTRRWLGGGRGGGSPSPK
ncbi:hypothetical protein BU14_0071s0051 [Porphyra umbilicalis]|uniref:Pre-mRNA-processing factor 19 n=1 Tax=Porphyra umbilicalis TaxID=2786 RepID=A0A1X6PG14_PORUM|nr:hypothetical protein BU14_0071s0051 [Porphyra umbilicalis]|eukprot:OSX79797.1 hypothetical protein BU14_0071s0051 [Porphyra umbilicalis]